MAWARSGVSEGLEDTEEMQGSLTKSEKNQTVAMEYGIPHKLIRVVEPVLI